MQLVFSELTQILSLDRTRVLTIPQTGNPPYTHPYPIPGVPVPEPGYGSGTRVRAKNGPDSYFWTKTRPNPYPFYPYPFTRTLPDPVFFKNSKFEFPPSPQIRFSPIRTRPAGPTRTEPDRPDGTGFLFFYFFIF